MIFTFNGEKVILDDLNLAFVIQILLQACRVVIALGDVFCELKLAVVIRVFAEFRISFSEYINPEKVFVKYGTVVNV